MLGSEVKNYNIQCFGKHVQVRIIDVPVPCYQRKAYFRFEYRGKVHIKDLTASQCNNVLINKAITLKTDDDSSAFLCNDEDVTSEIVALLILIITWIIFITIGFKRKKLQYIKAGNYIKKKKPLQRKNGRYGNKI